MNREKYISKNKNSIEHQDRQKQQYSRRIVTAEKYCGQNGEFITYICHDCTEILLKEYNFCPKCGAKIVFDK